MANKTVPATTALITFNADGQRHIERVSLTLAIRLVQEGIAFPATDEARAAIMGASL